jgi:signal peptidase II
MRSAKHHRAIPVIVIALAVLATDQIVKAVITEFIMQPPREIALAGFLNLVLSFNTGVSFGMFADALGDSATALGIVQAVLTVLILGAAMRVRQRSEAVALALIAGGAAGNVMDRLHRGAVVDFLDFHAAGYHWPAFNIADIAIVTGAALFVFAAVLPSLQGRNQSDGTKI